MTTPATPSGTPGSSATYGPYGTHDLDQVAAQALTSYNDPSGRRPTPLAQLTGKWIAYGHTNESIGTVVLLGIWWTDDQGARQTGWIDEAGCYRGEDLRGWFHGF